MSCDPVIELKLLDIEVARWERAEQKAPTDGKFVLINADELKRMAHDACAAHRLRRIIEARGAPGTRG